MKDRLFEVWFNEVYKQNWSLVGTRRKIRIKSTLGIIENISKE